MEQSGGGPRPHWNEDMALGATQSLGARLCCGDAGRWPRPGSGPSGVRKGGPGARAGGAPNQAGRLTLRGCLWGAGQNELGKKRSFVPVRAWARAGV